MPLLTHLTADLLMGHGGAAKLELRHDVPVPSPKAAEVWIKVGVSAVNNTDINTRIGWYSKRVEGATTAENMMHRASVGAERLISGRLP